MKALALGSEHTVHSAPQPLCAAGIFSTNGLFHPLLSGASGTVLPAERIRKTRHVKTVDFRGLVNICVPRGMASE